MLRNNILIISVMFFVFACASLDQEKVNPERFDPHSNSNFNEIVITHMDINFDVDFDSQQLKGEIKYTLDNFSGTSRLILDTRDLSIDKIYIGNNKDLTTFTKSTTDPIKGEALTITIKPSTENVTIHYKTSPFC